MKCPYCAREMEAGAVVVAVNAAPYWRREGSKRTLADAVVGKGMLPFHHFLMENGIPGYHCPSCEKIILDTAQK